MTTYLSAGVYIKETDLSQVVQTTSTSIGGIVGEFTRGPVNTLTLITNTKQFVDIFGTPSLDSTWPTAYCAMAFLERSSQLWVVRTVPSSGGPTYAGGKLTVSGTTSSVVGGPASVTDPNDVTFSGNTEFAYFYNLGPGTYGNDKKIAIRSDNVIPYVAGDITLTDLTTGGSLVFNTTYAYRIGVITKYGEILGAEKTITLANDSLSTHRVQIDWPKISNALSYKVYGRTSGGELFIESVSQPTSGTTVTYIDDGSITPAGALPTSNDTVSYFTVDIYDTEKSNSVPQESFTVTMADTLDGFGQQMEIETRINTFSKLVRVIKNPSYNTAGIIYSVSATSISDGTDGASPTASNIVNAWDLFADPEKVTVRILINGGASAVSVQQKMDSLARSRGDCVAILDLPTAYQEVSQAVIFRQQLLNLNSNRSALYAPDFQINDSFNDKVIYVPPSGHVAGVYANNDFVAQAWFAPAGLNRGLLNILSLRYKYNQAERDILASNQINYARNFPGQGIAVWEALTLQSNLSALSYVNVRRLLDVIEISISQALNYSVWEPNDDFLRRSIVGLVTEFLDAIRNRRGIIDFAVVSDETNNPPSVTGTGQLNVDVYITPTLPAQKIQLQSIITKQGASFEELIATGGNF